MSIGSEEPPYAPGTLRIYSMRFCPYAQRVLLVLAAKKIPHELVNVDLQSKPDWFLLKHKEGKVPLMQHDSKFLWESLYLAEYLDEAYPNLGPKLVPSDPYQRARDKIVIDKTFPKLMTSTYRIKDADAAGRAELAQAFNTDLSILEEELKQRGGKFLGGDSACYADLMIWPVFQHFIAMTEIFDDVKLSPPTLVGSWIDAMRLNPAVVESVDRKALVEFRKKMVLEGVIDYDVGV